MAGLVVGVVRPPDEPAFRAFVEASSARLLRTAFLLTGDWQRAEDLLQTALTRTWSRWRTLREPEAAEAYVRRVLVTTSSTWWRRKWHGERPAEHLPEQPDPRDATAELDRRETVLAALATLPPRQRAVIVLRFYDDMTPPQVAEALGCAVGTVKSQTSKGLATLAKHAALGELVGREAAS